MKKLQDTVLSLPILHNLLEIDGTHLRNAVDIWVAEKHHITRPVKGGMLVISASLASASTSNKLLLSGGTFDKHYTLLHTYAQVTDAVCNQPLAVTA